MSDETTIRVGIDSAKEQVVLVGRMTSEKGINLALRYAEELEEELAEEEVAKE